MKAEGGRKGRHTGLRCAAAVVLLAAAGLVPRAVETQEAGAVLVRAAPTGELPQEERDKVRSALRARGRDLQHVVVLVHGWDTSFSTSAEEFGQAGKDLTAEFARLGERAAVVGFQWPSDVGAARSWLPKSAAHTVTKGLGFRNAVRDPYLDKVPRARTTGRVGLRQLLFDLEDALPGVRLHVITHSMGAEVAGHAMNPGLTVPPKKAPPAYLPGRPVRLGLLVLAGSDLDYDAIGNRADTAPPGTSAVGWITMPKLDAPPDKALNARKIQRGKKAMGNTFPLLEGEQLDDLIGARRLVCDTENIPPDHAYLKYLNPQRLRRVAEAATMLRNPGRGCSPLLVKLDEVLKAPGEAARLAPYVDDPETSVKVYGLWRLERLLCGDCRHLETGYSMEVLVKGPRHPDWLAKERERTKCEVVKEGYWPPRSLMARASSD